MKILKRVALALLVLLLMAVAAVWTAGRGTFGRFDSEDKLATGRARAPESIAEGEARQAAAARSVRAGADAERQILFGDLHVHTTISFDAFMLNLPLMGGEGAHPPADACDFARHCAALDFWSINDHAANIHPDDWRNTVDAVRQCNDLAGDPANPDTVSFLGWEWTQAGKTPDEHYGHKNVVLAHTDDSRIPTRPIAASAGGTASLPPPVFARGLLTLQDDRFHDLARRWTELGELDACDDAPVRELPDDCREIAATPAELFSKLDDWDHDALVIPHGTAWGIYTPPGSSWDKQLVGDMHDPERQTLIEVYSGHGDSEPYRDWRAVEFGGDGLPRCPEEERPDYLPMCQRAGQIVKQRCLDAGEGPAECELRAARARDHAAKGGVSPHVTVPGTRGTDWLDGGQCRDCDQPAFKLRPANSAQYITALGNFANGDAPARRFRMGFIASSDIHNARAGTGYKEKRFLTDAGNRAVDLGDGIIASFLRGPDDPPDPVSRPYEEAAAKLRGLQLFETERSQSFLYTGGLVAVHATGRDRGSVWAALERKEVYGTSGPRILLWFDLVRGAERMPMGSELTSDRDPEFEVRAVGSFEQAAGCPADAAAALGADRLDRLCRNECYHPTDARRPISRIEVVRIRPQAHTTEDIGSLIDDPWLRFDCDPARDGCTARFNDPDFVANARDTVYYARVFEPPTPTVNGGSLRCVFDDQGRCSETAPCERGDECLAAYEPRAWSSPIYVDFDGTGR